MTTTDLAIRETPARYADALDRQDPTALAEVLTEDATWTFSIDGAPGPGPFIGRPAILDFVRDAAPAPADRRRHHLTTVVVERAGSATAAVRAHLLLTSGAGLVATGSYTFRLRRTGDEWRIAELFLEMNNR